MKLTITPLKVVSVNSYKKANFIEIDQGETMDFYFQLQDKDQEGLRYVPASGAVVYVEIPRFPDYLPTLSNTRTEVDYSIRRNAVQAFPGQDASIWRLPLTAADTAQIMSSDIRVTLTEGSKISKTVFPQALKVVTSEEVPN